MIRLIMVFIEKNLDHDQHSGTNTKGRPELLKRSIMEFVVKNSHHHQHSGTKTKGGRIYTSLMT